MNLRACLTFCLFAAPIFSQTIDRITAAINPASHVALPNAVNPAIATATFSQPADPAFPMDHMILSLSPTAIQQTALQTLLIQQQDPGSSNFHKFLTPAQYAAAFGASASDLTKITAWLTSNGFTIDQVTPNHLAIIFSGNASQVQSAFKTQIMQYVVAGQTHHANATAPQIPTALAAVVQGLVKLNDFHSKSPALNLKPLYNATPSSHYLVPGDYAIIYNLNPLFRSGFTGASQTIGIVGRSNVNPADIATFRLDYGLPASAITPVYATGTDPGIATNGDQIEATLDVEWAGANAPRANIKLIMAASTATTDGVDLAAQYAVNNNVASILSVSFGACEVVVNNAFYNTLWQQAAAQGISVFVSAGDNGAAGCDSSSASTGTLKSVNGICSSPSSTCVGGTQFADTQNPGQYWLASNNAVMGSAISYIPEVAWNESALVPGGAGLASGGGGASSAYLKPYWQVAPGVPADGHRDVPDISLTAAQHDGYVIVYNNATAIVSGTSAAAPSFAGIMALLSQKFGGAQGNVNQTLYPLAARGTQAGNSPIFHDVTLGNNSVPGVTGYTASAGYDLATGLGSVDATQLANNWTSLTGGFSIAASAPSVNVSPSLRGSILLTVTDLGLFSSPVSFSISSLPAGITANFSTNTLTASGTNFLTFAAAGSSNSGTYPIIVTATGGGIIRTASFNLIVVVSTSCTLTALPTSLSIVESHAASIRLVCGSAQGIFPTGLSLSVTGTPTGVSTSFSPSVLLAGTGVSTLVVNVTNSATPGTYTLVVTAALPNSNPAFSQTLIIPITISAAATFSITPSISTVSFQQGGFGSVVLTSLHSGAFNAPVTFSASGLPSSIATSFSANTIAAPGDGNITITLQSLSVVPAGNYTMTVLALGAGLSLRIPIAIHVAAAPAFTLTSSAAVLTLRQSTAATIGTSSVSFNIGTLINNFNFPVGFTVSGLPSGVTAAFSSATIAAPGTGSTVLALTSATTATAGISTFTVTAAGNTIARSINIQLIVTPSPTFSIAASVPTYNMLAGAVLTETINATGLYGYNSNITLSAGTLPVGLVVSFLSNSINGYNGSTTMTIQPVSTLTPGSYPITITATDPVTTATRTAQINLAVGTVTTALSVPTLSVVRNGSASLTITTTAVSYAGFTSLSVGNLPLGVSYALTQSTLAGSSSANLTISASSSVAPGTYIVTVRAFADGIATTKNLVIIVT